MSENGVSICKECGDNFKLSFVDIEFFKDKGLVIPKRCIKCRRKRR